MDFEVRTFCENGIEMKYMVMGHGKRALVVLPGLSVKYVTDSGAAVANVFRRFYEEFTVYLFDRRSNSVLGYCEKDMAQDTVFAMKSLGIEKACFYGASQGGMICQHIAVLHPEVVDRMVLASCILHPDDRSRSIISGWVEYASERDCASLVPDMVDNIYGKVTLETMRDALLGMFDCLTDDELARFVINASACRDYSPIPDDVRPSCPTLVAASKGDRIFDIGQVRELAERFNAELVVYDECYGHAVYDENPDFFDRMEAFFKG